MFKNFTNKISASLTIKLNGEGKNRLISIAIKDGIRFWNYKYKNECIYADISINDYKLIRKYKSKTKTKITLLRKNGLPFKFKKLSKHKGLILGLIFSTLLYIYLSSCYWVIDVGTQGIYTDEEIIDFAKENGLKIGTPKNQLDEEELSVLIMMNFDKLKWASVNTYGCFVTIDVKYSEPKPQIDTADDISNIVASKAGIVRHIESTYGRIMVENGTAVSAGDILITGIWDENYDKNEWTMVEDPVLFETSSRGIVMAETQNIITVCTPKTNIDYEEIKSYNRYKLGLFSLEIPLCFNLVPEGEYFYQTNRKYLNILDVKIPIFWSTETLTKVQTTESAQNKTNAKEVLDELLNKKALSMLSQNEELLRIADNSYFEDENNYYLTSNCIFLEDISLIEKVLTK